MPPDKFAAQVKSQTCSRDPMSTSIIRAYKTAKDTGLLRLRNTYPFVPYRNLRGTSCVMQHDSNIDYTSFGTILDGIVDQVYEHLLNTLRIDIDDNMLRRCMDKQTVTRTEHT